MTLQSAPPTHTDLLIVATGAIFVVALALGFTAAFIVARYLDRRDRQRLADRWDEQAIRQHHTATDLQADPEPAAKIGGHMARGRANQLDDCARELLNVREER